MNQERLEELAALKAAGAISSQEWEELRQCLSEGNAKAREELAKFHNVAALMAAALSPSQSPSAHCKEQLFRRLEDHIKSNQSQSSRGFHYVKDSAAPAWTALPHIPGAFVRLLSLDREQGLAILLGKLEPGVRYPAHRHFGAEDVYMLTGDLRMGDFLLGPGDFHHADPGTVHAENYSQNGCTLLAVISIEDLEAQADPTSSKWVKA